MSGRPIAPLASVDVAGRVIYLNSFTKSLGAAFRIAYMALPEDLAAQFELKLGFTRTRSAHSSSLPSPASSSRDITSGM